MSHFQNVNHCEKPKVFESHVGVLSMKLLKGKAAKFPRTTFQPHFPSLPSLIWKFIPERRVFWHFFFFRAYQDIAHCCALFLCCLGGDILPREGAAEWNDQLSYFFAGKKSNYIYLITKNGIFSSHVLGAIRPFSLIFS